MKTTLKQKLTIINSISITAILVIVAINFFMVLGIKNNFTVMKTKQIDGKIATLNITTDMNYISRLSRNIMLGSDFEKDMEKMHDRIKRIESNFDILEASLVHKDEKDIFQKSKNAALNFIYDARDFSNKYSKLDASEKYAKYPEYTKRATPLAIESRKYFNELVKLKDIYFTTEISNYESRISANQITSSVFAIIISVLIIIVVVIFSRSIVNTLGADPNELAKIAKDTSEGDISNTNKKETKKGSVLDSMYEMQNKLKEIVSSIRNGADNLVSASDQISSTAHAMSQGAAEQASSVEEVSSTMEQIAANIEQNTDNAQQTEKISNTAHVGIQDVSKESSNTVVANKKISEKINIVQDIAFQTNILALNAAVEAARAGEHGKGFAVVAAEVRKLAERSKVASEEIVALANNSLEMAENAGKKMEEILPEVVKTAQLIQEISSASIEQNNGASQVNSAIQQLNNVTQQNAAASEELSSNAEEMNSQAELLKEMIAYFKIG